MLILAAVAAIVAFNIGMEHRRKIAEQKIGGAEEEARQIVAAAVKQAESKKREAIVEAREEIQKNRTELEKEIKERRNELTKQERRLQQKEESLERKHDAAEKKEENLNRKIKEAEEMNDEIREIRQSELDMLEKISGFTAEEAKEYLIRMIETDARHEAAVKIREIDQEIKENAERKAREYISLAIQKCAADQVSEAAISVCAAA